MNPELRLDRLERVLMLAIRAGYRERQAWREQSREQTEKINAMISTHMDAMDRLDKRAAEEMDRLDKRAAEESGGSPPRWSSPPPRQSLTNGWANWRRPK